MSNNPSSGWTEMSFGEMATQISERVDDPQKAGVDIYVGLEHLDPGDLKIRRHGSPSDVEATKLRVRPGQIIFGKRRAYQRKVAVADFDGICSAHAMVLQEKPSLVPGFLPYFMQSDVFMDRAVTISEGGLSPTIKWKTLAEQKFLVPPPEQQCELVEIMQAFDEALEQSSMTIKCFVELDESLLNYLFSNDSSWSEYRIADVSDVKIGLQRSPQRAIGNRPIKYIRVANVKEGHIDFSDIYEMDFTKEEEVAYKVNFKDILLIDGGEARDVGMCSLFPETENIYCHQNHVIRIRVDTKVVFPEFMYQILRLKKRRGVFSNLSSGTKIKNLGVNKIRDLKINIPNSEVQQIILNKITKSNEIIKTAQDKIQNLTTAKVGILNTSLLVSRDIEVEVSS